MRICDLREGDKVWLARFSFGKVQCRECTPPKEFELERLNEEVLKVKGMCGYYFRSDDSRPIEAIGFFETEEEARDYYNTRIQNEIDRLTSNYEKAMKNLKRKILK